MENVGGRYGGNACKEGKKMKLKKQEKAEYAGLYITFQHRRRKEGTKGRHLILYSHQAEIMLWKIAVICFIWIKIIHNFQTQAHMSETDVLFFWLGLLRIPQPPLENGLELETVSCYVIVFFSYD